MFSIEKIYIPVIFSFSKSWENKHRVVEPWSFHMINQQEKQLSYLNTSYIPTICLLRASNQTVSLNQTNCFLCVFLLLLFCFGCFFFNWIVVSSKPKLEGLWFLVQLLSGGIGQSLQFFLFISLVAFHASMERYPCKTERMTFTQIQSSAAFQVSHKNKMSKPFRSPAKG